jgi:uncharacterized protein
MSTSIRPMTEIFVDTWAWYALADRADADHELAQLTNEELLTAGDTFATSNFVRDEALTLIRYRLGHAAAVRFGRTLNSLIDAGLVNLVRIDDAHEATAWEIFERYSDQSFSYTDCTSFAVMQALDLLDVFTADRHFATLGFVCLPTSLGR